MGLFRLEENVPSVYPSESRDFQLFCRLYDALNSGVKYDIDTLEYLSNNFYISTKMLQIAQTGVGYFPKVVVNAEALRYVLVAFPYILKYKGSKRGIKEAVRVFLKGLRISSPVSVDIDNVVYYTDSMGNRIEDTDNSYRVRIGLQIPFRDMTVLNDILSYVIPIGYSLEYTFMADATADDSVKMSDSVTYLYVSNNINSQIKSSDGTYMNYSKDRQLTQEDIAYDCSYCDTTGIPFRVLSQVGMTEILSSQNANMESGNTVLKDGKKE